MPLTPWPELSVAALERLDRCERLFSLADVDRMAWPAPDPKAPTPETRPRLELGEAFHRLAHLQVQGVPDAALLDAYHGWEHGPQLAALWASFLAAPVSGLGEACWSELPLHLAMGPLRWTVRFDRVLRRPDGQWLLLDWKTGPAFDGEAAATSWQTRLYRYSLATGGNALNDGQPISPERISLTYWHVATGLGYAFPYDLAAMEGDRLALEAVAERLARIQEKRAEMNPDHCGRCRFRFRCHPHEQGADPAPETAIPLPRFQFPS